MSFSVLSSAWLFLLLAPLVVFYFLKLRRPKVEIPSLFLWQQVLADQRVNSPFQKFKRNLLLLLQILLLCLVVLAAMQPLLRGDVSRAARLPILIDVSASMGARTTESGPTRLDKVKQRVRALIDNLPGDQAVSLIAFSRNARRLTPFTDNLGDLRATLDTLEVEDVPGDLDEALRMAQAIGRSTPFDRVLLYSDGNFPAKTNFELPFQIDYQRVAPGGTNYGIIACQARRATGGKWEVFVQLASSGEAESTTGTLELRQDGTVVAQESVSLTKGGTPRVAFTLANDRTSLLHVRLVTNHFDALASDNDAWLTLPTPRSLEVYVSPKLLTYQRALQPMEGLVLYPREGESLPKSFDLVIGQEEADFELVSRVKLGIGFVPADLQKLLTIEAKNSTAIDWRRDAPLLQHVSLSDVVMLDQPVNAAGTDESSYANLGFEILAHGTRGPLIVSRSDESSVAINLLFHSDRSTLPYRVGFPVLISNIVEIARQSAGLSEAGAAHTGALPPLNFIPDAASTITGPGGLKREDRTDARGQLRGVPAPRAGEYAIAVSGNEPVKVGAAVLSIAETSLAAVDRIEFGDQLSAAAGAEAPKTDRSLWWLVATIGFVVALVEWWWFQRRASLAA